MVLIKPFTTNLRIVESELLFTKSTKLMSQILIKPQYLLGVTNAYSCILTILGMLHVYH